MARSKLSMEGSVRNRLKAKKKGFYNNNNPTTTTQQQQRDASKTNISKPDISKPRQQGRLAASEEEPLGSSTILCKWGRQINLYGVGFYTYTQ
uniref:Uncharacterized protein n=1 Tax=Caenorhabditis japonica TaxID=281687 RepID=A0A8R1HK99_CAEJA